MKYAVIDFETANGHRCSPCSLGVCILEDFKVVQEYYYLINPEMKFDYRNIDVHGIRPINVYKERNFAEVWEELLPLVADCIFVAHNAAFDMEVLAQTLARYGLDIPHIDYHCTYLASKTLNLPAENNKLDSICKFLNIPLENHHNALDDARACANIFIELTQMYGLNIFSTYSTKNINISHIINTRLCNNLFCLDLPYTYINSLTELKNKTIVLTGECEKVTRTELIRVLGNQGAIIRNNVSGKTNFLIVGIQDNAVVIDNDNHKSRKIVTAEELIKNGAEISLLSMDDIAELMEQEAADAINV